MALAERYTSLEDMLAGGDRLVRLRRGADLLGKHSDTLKRWAQLDPPRIRLVRTSARSYDVWLSELARFVRESAAESEAYKADDEAGRQRLRLVAKARPHDQK